MIFKTTLSEENWRTKYKYGDECPLDTFVRVAREIAEVEKNYGATEEEVQNKFEKFLKTLVFLEEDEDTDESEEDVISLSDGTYRAEGLKATPGGRITANAGTNYEETTLWNCFINGPVSNAKIEYDRPVPNSNEDIRSMMESEQTPDNLTNIFLSLLEAAETLKSEGGYGMNFGFIRPRGTLIEGVGIRHPGVVSYMDLWDRMSEIIVKGDNDGYKDQLENHLTNIEEKEDQLEKAMPRKGAMLAALPVWHPDIEEFVRAKQESGRLTKFNISVLIDDGFMEAVENDELYELHFNGKTYKKIRAKELYDLIMESTYNRNEPGVLFFDNANRCNPLLYLGPNSAANPCVTGDTKVSVVDERGSVPISDLVESDSNEVEVYTTNPESGEVEKKIAKNFRKTGSDKKVWHLHTQDGFSFKATPDHKILTKKDGYKELRDLKPNDILEPTDQKVQSVFPSRKEDVYDCTVKDNHNYIVTFEDQENEEGVTVHNCGEIPGSTFVDKEYDPAPYLEPYLDGDEHHLGFTTVCLLGSINLTQFVNEDRTFDWESYQNTVSTFARMLENVNDIDMAPLPAYRWAIEKIRQYGMGINGLGSALYMMGMKYGSEKAIEFTEKVNALKDDITLRESALLAEERGPFPMYDDRYLETPYFKKHCEASKETKELVREHGVRNAKRLTNPPLGSSSIICNNVSNGIEPVFNHEYERTVIADGWPEGLNKENVKEKLDQIQAGDATAWRGEYNGKIWYYEPHNRGICFIEKVRDYGYQWVKDHYPEDIENEESYLATSENLSVDEHVDMQEVVQGHCDQSVSKTSNLPHDYPFEDFKRLYKEAWDAGLVGFTTYRAGTMETVLESTEDSNENPNQADSLLDLLLEKGCVPPDATLTEDDVIVRDIHLPDKFSNGPTQKVRAEGNKYYIHLSYLPGDDQYPVAFWVHSNELEDKEYVSINRAVKATTKLLIHMGVDMDMVLDYQDKISDDPHHVRLGKMISMALRHNIGLPNIVSSIENIEGNYIASTLTAVRKFLKERIEDGTKVRGATCEVCGSDSIIYESGCSKCMDCGNSGCS